MPNLFLGFPVSRAAFAEVAGRAPGHPWPFEDFYYRSHFESLDGLLIQGTNGGSVYLGDTYLALIIVPGAVAVASFKKKPSYSLVPLTWDKKRTLSFRTRFYSTVDSSMEAWLGTGDLKFGSGIGLYFKDGILYARTNKSGANTDILIEDFGLAGFDFTRKFVIKLTPTVDVKFYLDDILVATIITNLPTGSTNANTTAWFELKNVSTTDAGNFRISYLDIYQKA